MNPPNDNDLNYLSHARRGVSYYGTVKSVPKQKHGKADAPRKQPFLGLGAEQSGREIHGDKQKHRNRQKQRMVCECLPKPKVQKGAPRTGHAARRARNSGQPINRTTGAAQHRCHGNKNTIHCNDLFHIPKESTIQIPAFHQLKQLYPMPRPFVNIFGIFLQKIAVGTGSFMQSLRLNGAETEN